MREQNFVENGQAEWPTLFEGIEEKKSKRKDRRVTKKDRILKLYAEGVTEIDHIAELALTSPSYVADVLNGAGLLSGYYDLYTTTGRDQNVYSKFFRNVLSFKSPEAARESVERINNLFRYFERIGDRAGQHHAQVVALTGRNRARWSGKSEEARIFAEWLMGN